MVGRKSGLDGLRGLAALYVVVYHVFLRAYPGYPRVRHPWWAPALGYGRFAVVTFIVLSGFSLALGPAAHGWRLGGTRAYAVRRARRILPAYWAALIFSTAMTWYVVAQPGWPVPGARDIAVHALLLQDTTAAASPNRAFWSIAIEIHLYVLLPLLLIACRRLHPLVMLAAVVAAVAVVQVFAPTDVLARTVPEMAALFALGVVAAGIAVAAGTTVAGRRAGEWPWAWIALVAGMPVVAWIVVSGPVYVQAHLYDADLALGPVIAALLVAVAIGRPARLASALDVAPLRRLGSFSYSLYLTHLPIVVAVHYGLVAGRVPPGWPTLVVELAIVVPLALAVAWAFAAVFEWPFQVRRPTSPVPVADRPTSSVPVADRPTSSVPVADRPASPAPVDR